MSAPHRVNVVVAVARCSIHHQLFGMRVEERTAGQWLADWAFTISEAVAGRERYGQAEVHGRFGIDAAFPGCPYCHSRSFFKCGVCYKLTCWDTVSTQAECAWCNHSNLLSGSIDSLQIGNDH